VHVLYIVNLDVREKLEIVEFMVDLENLKLGRKTRLRALRINWFKQLTTKSIRVWKIKC